MRRPAELDDLDRRRPMPPPVAPTFVRPMGVHEAVEQDFARARLEAEKMRREGEQALREGMDMLNAARDHFQHVEYFRVERRRWSFTERLVAWWFTALVVVLLWIAVK